MTDIKDAVDQLVADQALFHQLVHGDENAEVITEAGTQPSIKKAIQDQIVIPNNDTATNAAAAAESEDNAEIYKNAALVSETNAAGSATAGAGSAAAAQADRVLAEAAKVGAQTAEANAVAVVSGGEASLPAAPGMMPIAGASGKIDGNWLDYSIPALSAQYPGLNVVAACFYDTSKDSDGGAWIHRTAELSYGKEARPSGRYVGAFATNAEADAADSTFGHWYYNTVTGEFREHVVGGWDKIYRAGSATFPAQALIVAEADRVIVFDASGPELTMWMVLVGAGSAGTFNLLSGSGITCSSAVATNGRLYVGINGANYPRAIEILFAKDQARRWLSSGNSLYLGHISQRNDGKDYAAASGAAIVHSTVNAVAVTVLDNAPTDPATGLKNPTVAVATDGGVSVIRDDGNVWDITTTVSIDEVARSVSFNGDQLVFSMSRVGDGANGVTIVSDIPSADTDINALSNKRQYKSNYGGIGTADLLILRGSPRFETISKVVGVKGGFSGAVIGNAPSEKGMVVVHENPSAPAFGMFSRISDKVNTGYMVGGTQLAALCETETGAITETELVTNGTGLVDTDGWTSFSAELSISGGRLVITSTAAAYAQGLQVLSVVAGKTYRVTGVGRRLSGASGWILVGSNVDLDVYKTLALSNNDTPLDIYVTPTSNSLRIQGQTHNVNIGDSVEIGDISVGDFQGRCRVSLSRCF